MRGSTLLFNLASNVIRVSLTVWCPWRMSYELDSAASEPDKLSIPYESRCVRLGPADLTIFSLGFL